jgi:hypothetical protein
MATEDPDEVVRLLTAPNPAMAHIWEQTLAAEGIRARVVGDYLDAGWGDVPMALPELWVRRKDVERAQEILREEVVGDEARPPSAGDDTEPDET